ncbi:glycosyltransferase family 1 protein [Ornithobacterium rhinotracheale]|uniref:glycosyltransferase family 4 protein n=1 Tax=Ornithobacterium rhinotracheale TaxID=28251 RepID=UPI00129CC9EF|nr:glycosyltransferase family 1 protein [Ornithobacterium rhinotracheale]MRJ09579.1 glycosyltransferase family 1 protein [Ornithobacterium rhinotracheale]
MRKIYRVGYDAKRAYHNASGLGNYSRDLIRMVAQQGQEWHLALFNPKTKNKFAVLDAANIKEINPRSRFWRFFSGLWRSFRITSLAKEEKLDLYHGLSGEIPIGIHKKVSTIVTIHDLIFLRFPDLYTFFDRKIHFLKFKYAAQHAKHIIAISQQTKDDIVQFLKVPAEKISVVYQGCNEAFKKEYTKREKQFVKEKYGLPDEFVLNVGTIEPRKNALSIVKAIKDIDTTLVIVGRKTKYYNQIEEYLEAHNITHKVKVLKNVDMQDLAIIYQLATIFCYPSVFEGFGIPIIEALFSKTPVITSQGSCFPEAGGENSLYINPNSQVEDLKNHIVKLLENPDLRSEMAEKGFTYAQKFNDEVVRAEILKIYKNFMDYD